MVCRLSKPTLTIYWYYSNEYQQKEIISKFQSFDFFVLKLHLWKSPEDMSQMKVEI